MKFTKNDNGFTGLEAAIVLIAFVVVAAVFSYVVLGAGFFTTQKAQESVYTSVAQATSNIQVVGQVYGITSGSAVDGIKQIRFSIGLAPGSPTLDISKLRIAFSTPTTTPVIYTAATSGTTTPDYSATNPTFIALENGMGSMINSLTAQNQTQISFNVSPLVSKNTVINIEIRPAVGAALPFSKTTPPSLTQMNVLY
jgi:flagellin FlaB